MEQQTYVGSHEAKPGKKLYLDVNTKKKTVIEKKNKQFSNTLEANNSQKCI